MAIASCSVQVISRGKGRSAVAAAAYRSGQALRNAYDGLSHDYTRKTGIAYTAILAPQGAPEWVSDRSQLWNRAELIERCGDARLAREVMIALPQELSPNQNIELARAYAQTFVRQGMIADVSIHDSGDGNPHAHIMLTTRPLDGNEFSKKKNRDWDSKDNLIGWRQAYEKITNQYLERYGHEERIDVRSYADQGIDQIPTIHLGPHAYRMEQRGIQTDRGDINREIEKDNQRIREIVKQIAILEQECQRLKSKEHSMIEHYMSMKEEIRKTAEELGQRLTEKGWDILLQQQKNVENTLGQLQQPTQGQETPAHRPLMDELEQQRQLGFDKLYENPSNPPQPHPEQPRSEEGPSRPNRPPPLRRQQREERHLAGERSRHRPQGYRTQAHHVLNEEAERRRKARYDKLYEEPSGKQATEPKHHSPDPSAERGRKTGFDRLYDNPADGEQERERSSPDLDLD